MAGKVVLPRVWVPITLDDFRDKVMTAVKKILDKEHVRPGQDVPFTDISGQVRHDLEAVRFAVDETDWVVDQYTSEAKRGFIGFQTLPNGMPFLGVEAGADYEERLYFIIYWDGQLRAYIPKDGNTFDREGMASFRPQDVDYSEYLHQFFPDVEIEALADSMVATDCIRRLFDAEKMLDDIQAKIVRAELPIDPIAPYLSKPWPVAGYPITPHFQDWLDQWQRAQIDAHDGICYLFVWDAEGRLYQADGRGLMAAVAALRESLLEAQKKEE